MLTKTEKSFSLIFFSVVIIELICENVSSLSDFRFVTKPAILLVLIIFFLRQSKHLNTSTKRITLFALVFSLLGDVLLMFVDKSSNFFMSGLIAFLIAHIMYVSVFLKKQNSSKNVYFFIASLLLYAFGMFYFLKDGLHSMLIPVVIYMFVILLMATTAFLRKDMVNNLSYNLVFVGAIFFMISDSLLALNKFYEPVLYPNITIMLTYAIAQYLIVLGILKQRD